MKPLSIECPNLTCIINQSQPEWQSILFQNCTDLILMISKFCKFSAFSLEFNFFFLNHKTYFFLIVGQNNSQNKIPLSPLNNVNIKKGQVLRYDPRNGGICRCKSPQKIFSWKQPSTYCTIFFFFKYWRRYLKEVHTSTERICNNFYDMRWVSTSKSLHS